MQVSKLDRLSLFTPDPSLPSFTLFFGVGVSLNPELTNLYKLAGQKALWLCLALPGSAFPVPDYRGVTPHQAGDLNSAELLL